MIQEQELSERKLKILQAIIKNYLETGEPVGSRTISKYTDLNLSSATIRNEDGGFGRTWIYFTASYVCWTYSFGQRLQTLCRYADGAERTGTK